jgi:ABC-type multidrug transport system fused ATPase/permease subunit
VQVLHDRLLDKVLSLPMSFFDTQPSGRLISRFTNDVSECDHRLGYVVSQLVECLVGVTVATFVLAVATKGAVLLALVALIPVYSFVQNRHLQASRELHRLGRVANSPLITHIAETLSGLMTLRAFSKQVSFHPRRVCRTTNILAPCHARTLE